MILERPSKVGRDDCKVRRGRAGIFVEPRLSRRDAYRNKQMSRWNDKTLGAVRDRDGAGKESEERRSGIGAGAKPVCVIIT